MRLVSQASAMEVEQVEQAVVPAMETRGGSSKAVSVTLSARKVSSDFVSLSNWANGCPEGSGTGRGGCGRRVRHRQAEGLGAGGTIGWHRRHMQHLQEGGGHSQVHIWDWHGLRPMQVGQAALQPGARVAQAEEAH